MTLEEFEKIYPNIPDICNICGQKLYELVLPRLPNDFLEDDLPEIKGTHSSCLNPECISKSISIESAPETEK